MALIHHVRRGIGAHPVVFVHGFSCDHTDWDLQVAHLEAHHATIAVDLPGHGASAAAAEDCSIERYGAAVAALMRALDLPPATIVGHSMGCRVAVEAALQAPGHTRAVVLVDGSQFAAGMGPAMRAAFAVPDGYANLTRYMFQDMFTAKIDPVVARHILDRLVALPRAIGETILLDLQRYDVTRLTASLGCLRVPVLALQTTCANDKRERKSLQSGQSSPYLDMLRQAVPAAAVEIIADTGHFPQFEEPARTNAALTAFLGRV